MTTYLKGLKGRPWLDRKWPRYKAIEILRKAWMLLPLKSKLQFSPAVAFDTWAEEDFHL